jgi:uncharacterized protein YgiB involved in biofilm formation
MNTPDTEEKCEAKYGDNQCTKTATTAVASNGQIFSLCKDCATLARKQNKQNHNENYYGD